MSSNEPDEQHNINLKLGDIISFTPTSDFTLHDKTFLVDYLDNTLIKLIETDTFEKFEIAIVDGKLQDMSIEGIVLLDRSELDGYARNNDLLPDAWIDVHFAGDLPFIITGKITSLEEDMIEIEQFPDKTLFYIDFAYQGIPKDLNIEKIVIRDEPTVSKKSEELSAVPEEKEEQESEKKSETEIEKSREKTDEEDKPETTKREDEETIYVDKQELDQIIIDADQIKFGEELEEITQVIEVDESEKRFSIEKQTNDLLDEFLSVIPNSERTRKVMNRIHLTIERYKQLREKYSVYNQYGNISMRPLNGNNYKPLIESLYNLENIPKWILPIAKVNKKIFDVDVDTDEEVSDITLTSLEETYESEENILNNYKTNDIPDSQNKYAYLYRELSKYYLPFTAEEEESNILATKKVNSNITAIIDNIGDFYSTVSVDEMLSRKKFLMETFTVGIDKLHAELLTGNTMIAKRMPLTDNDIMSLNSFIFLKDNMLRQSRLYLPQTSILEKSELHHNYIPYWRLLRKNTPITTTLIEDDNQEITFLKTDLLKNIQHYGVQDTFQSDDKLKKYLDIIIPKKRQIIKLLDETAENSLSYHSFIKVLEPYLIYDEDITKDEYYEINRRIQSKIRTYKQRLVDKEKEFLFFKNYRYRENQRKNLLKSVILEDKTYQTIFDIYRLNHEKLTSNELLHQMNQIDNLQLFYTTIGIMDIDLHSTIDIKGYIKEKLTELEGKTSTDETEDKQCVKPELAKKYMEMIDLTNDNSKVIYFDKEFDDTPYDIYYEYLDQYDDEFSGEDMNSENFMEFLINKLKTVNGFSEENAEYIANNMVQQKKTVKNGQYAILEEDDDDSEDIYAKKYSYYKRLDNVWIEDTDISEDDFKHITNAFCNSSKMECLNIKNKCISNDKADKKQKISFLSSMIDEFDERYVKTKEEQTKMFMNNFRKYSDLVNVRFVLQQKN